MTTLGWQIVAWSGGALVVLACLARPVLDHIARKAKIEHESVPSPYFVNRPPQELVDLLKISQRTQDAIFGGGVPPPLPRDPAGGLLRFNRPPFVVTPQNAGPPTINGVPLPEGVVVDDADIIADAIANPDLFKRAEREAFEKGRKDWIEAERIAAREARAVDHHAQTDASSFVEALKEHHETVTLSQGDGPGIPPTVEDAARPDLTFEQYQVESRLLEVAEENQRLMKEAAAMGKRFAVTAADLDAHVRATHRTQRRALLKRDALMQMQRNKREMG